MSIDKNTILKDLQTRTDLATALIKAGEALKEVARLLDESIDKDAEKHGIDPDDYIRGSSAGH